MAKMVVLVIQEIQEYLERVVNRVKLVNPGCQDVMEFADKKVHPAQRVNQERPDKKVLMAIRDPMDNVEMTGLQAHRDLLELLDCRELMDNLDYKVDFYNYKI